MKSPLTTLVRDLGRRRGRERRGLAVAEGVRLVEEALGAGVPLKGAVISPGLESTPRGVALKEALRRRGVRIEEVTPAELDQLADTEHPQGIVLVFEPPAWSLESIPSPPGVVLVLDGVQDPGNVGSAIRTALSLGAAGLVALKGTAELTNPKVVRGSMGAVFRLPNVSADADAFLAWARSRGLGLWVADAGAPPVPRDPASRRAGVALVLGNEGAGVSPPLRQAADRRVGIPLAPGAESLNVAVAAGILLHELTRGE